MTEGFLPHVDGLTRAPSLSDRVAEELTRAIMAGEVPRGERLPSERELGSKFKVSRTVVREATRSLIARGLVKVTAGRGVEVSEANSTTVSSSMRLMIQGRPDLDYQKVHEVRTALELQITWLAAGKAQPQDIERLQNLCERHESSLKANDLEAAGEHDFQFHRALAQATQNALLLMMLDSISDVLREIRKQAVKQPHVGQQGLRAHQRILKQIEAGQADIARELMAEHLEDAARAWGASATHTKAKATATARKKRRPKR